MYFGTLVLEVVHYVVLCGAIHQSIMLLVHFQVNPVELVDVLYSQDDVKLWRCLD